jgi:hypothetical protein
MLRTKNLQISSDEPQLLNLDFGKSRNIKTGNYGHYPYFTALELDHLDNKQAELAQTSTKGAGIKSIAKKALDKATPGARRALEKVAKKTLDKKKDEVVKALFGSESHIALRKKQAKNNIDDLIGHLSSNNDDLDGGKIHIKKELKKAHVGRKLINVGKNVVLPAAKEAAKEALKDGATAFVESNPEFAPLLPVANVAIDKGIGSGLKKVNKRGEIVKKVMQEYSLSMIEASKFVKKNNLY